MQVQPPCQTRGAAATTAVLVVSVVKVVWAGGIGQALGESAGEAGGEKPRTALAQMQKRCHSPRMSLERGAFEAWLIIWGTQCSSERMYYIAPTITEFRLDSQQPSLWRSKQHNWQCS